MVTIGGIPVFNAIISDEETGMYKISLVDDPAVMSNFLAFDSARKMLMYKVEDEEKRLVRGVVMRADFPIYRYDKNYGEYYIIYKAEQIRKMAEKYLVESRQNDVNIMHQQNSDVVGVNMVQYFIKGNGVNVEGFEDIADGSLFAEFHVINDEVWNAIKDGSYKGFSLEGIFDLVPEKEVDKVENIVESLDGAFSKIINKLSKMSKLTRFKAALLKALAEFANVTTDKGILAWDGEEELAVGDVVFIEDEEGNRTPAEDGDYKTEDGKTIVVAEGKVAEIVDPETEVEPSEEATEEPSEEAALASVVTDKGDLQYEGELAVGVEVFVADEEGNMVAAADGDYALEDGTIIKVVEGKVAEIVAPATTEEVVEELKAEIAKLKKKISEYKKEIAELKAQPIAKSAHEEVTTSQKFSATGDKGLDKLARYFK